MTRDDAPSGLDAPSGQDAPSGRRAPDIYDPTFVKGVFDRCGRAYRWWSLIASFGFVALWRRQCVAALPEPPSDEPVCFDLMAGTGEAWPHLLRRFPHARAVTAIDISSTMHERALERLHRSRADRIALIEADVLSHEVPAGSADIVIATFGLKTFDAAQAERLSRTIARVLRPGGTFSLIEASDPVGWPLRPLYNLYLRRVLPLVERLFLRGAQDFAMIGVYTERFTDCRHVARCLEAEGLEVRFVRYFFGCATGVVGRKPAAEPGPMAGCEDRAPGVAIRDAGVAIQDAQSNRRSPCSAMT